MTNPLLQKYEELYGKKEEPKKVEYELDPEFVKQLENKSTLPTDPTTKKLPILTSYNNESLNDSFLQIAEKVKNKQAQIYSMNMDIDQQTRTQRITFEVWDTF
jgi:hypothetical protein